MSNKSEGITQTILQQLVYDACCRIHLHRECCIALGLCIEPRFNMKNQRIRICKDLPDDQFDKIFESLQKRRIHNKESKDKRRRRSTPQ